MKTQTGYTARYLCKGQYRVYCNGRSTKYVLTRGSFMGDGCDDLYSDWYVDHDDSSCADRRGRGFRTLADALFSLEQQSGVADYIVRTGREDLWS